MAIVAGAIARVSFLAIGDIGPFQVAGLLTFVALCMIAAWWDEPRNVASTSTSDGGNGRTEEKKGILKLVSNAWTDATSSSATMSLGISCALFEGAMFTFVFMWVPVLQSTYDSSKGERAPTEIVFSFMMVCVALGGAACQRVLSSYTIRTGGVLIFATASVAMAGCAVLGVLPLSLAVAASIMRPFSVVPFIYLYFLRWKWQ